MTVGSGRGRARALRKKRIADQKVVIADHDARHAAALVIGTQCADDRLVARQVQIVAQPQVEQVAQHVQLAVRAEALQKIDEARLIRRVRTQVQVGDEDAQHR